VKPHSLQITPLQSSVLDLSRWVAAFLVVIEHLRSLLFVSYDTGATAGGLWKGFYFATGFGHSAVMVFFVMSGFLVGGKALESFSRERFSWKQYAVNRVSRLYAVYLLALILGALLDYLGYHYLNRFGLYDRTFPGRIAVVNQDFHANLTPSIFGANLAMCQTILVPFLGSNGPLWSLANEFWYYLAGPLLFVLLFSRFTRFKWIPLLGLVLVVWFLPMHILLYFGVWLLGAALFFVNDRPLLPLWLTTPLFLLCFSLSRLQWVRVPLAGEFLIGISFALMLNSTATRVWRLPGHNVSQKAAAFSYSVYLCHFPFLVFILSALYQFRGIGFQQRPSVVWAALFVAILGLVCLWCYGISLVTEKQTPGIRRALNKLLGIEKSGLANGSRSPQTGSGLPEAACRGAREEGKDSR
jgi:peptidoglycan/LPS O-acetylase OafA/YrhL